MGVAFARARMCARGRDCPLLPSSRSCKRRRVISLAQEPFSHSASLSRVRERPRSANSGPAGSRLFFRIGGRVRQLLPVARREARLSGTARGRRTRKEAAWSPRFPT
ncbi:hypothetical protein FQA47_006495 [Oryzias melastigma]|uniref:Uncharacterized protein n=1 Tax=Oryzias melastigma TaxID=30732 RepID=A0A834FME4_ORYME|nr:hypothetical protein FQA47_006495 [Oryzias melastigma]